MCMDIGGGTGFGGDGSLVVKTEIIGTPRVVEVRCIHHR